MESIAEQVKHLTKDADATTRKRVITELRDLAISLEDSDDTLQRLSNTPLQLYGAWIGSTLRVFEILSGTTHPVSLEVLAKQTEANSTLLGRMLRYMASVKLVEETDHGMYTSNNVTKALATPKGQNSLELYYNVVNPVFYELPRFLEKTQFQNPSDETKTAFQDAYQFPGPIYEWWAANPDKAAIFNKHMEFRREGGRDWLDVFPMEKYTASHSSGQALFVDVGGNIGHQCARLKQAYPQLTGEVILQDLPYAIESALSIPGVENMVHDFFQPQPVKGALFYYLRGVLHCFTDEKCIQVLRNTATAMGPDSKILIDDAVFPNTNVFWQATQMDMLMMSSMASMERSRKQWETVLEAAGLKIVDVYVYSQALYESVIVAVKA